LEFDMLPTFIPRKPFRHRARAAQAAQVNPPPPPVPAVVVDAFLSEGGSTCTLVFDKPVTLAEPPFDFGDGAVQFNDQNPSGGGAGTDGVSVVFAVDPPVGPGSAWNVNGQPTWLTTPVAVPQNGTIE
jgi:hypothetical protein